MAEEGIEQRRMFPANQHAPSKPSIKSIFLLSSNMFVINVCAIKIILLVRCIVRKLDET